MLKVFSPSFDKYFSKSHKKDSILINEESWFLISFAFYSSITLSTDFAFVTVSILAIFVVLGSLNCKVSLFVLYRFSNSFVFEYSFIMFIVFVLFLTFSCSSSISCSISSFFIPHFLKLSVLYQTSLSVLLKRFRIVFWFVSLIEKSFSTSFFVLIECVSIYFSNTFEFNNKTFFAIESFFVSVKYSSIIVSSICFWCFFEFSFNNFINSFLFSRFIEICFILNTLNFYR